MNDAKQKRTTLGPFPHERPEGAEPLRLPTMSTAKQEQLKHTPGPWRIAPYYQNDVVSDAGMICSCKPSDLVEIARANARLIAVSPEMYDALKIIVAANQQAHIDGDYVCPEVRKAIQHAEAILAKTKGASHE